MMLRMIFRAVYTCKLIWITEHNKEDDNNTLRGSFQFQRVCWLPLYLIFLTLGVFHGQMAIREKYKVSNAIEAKKLKMFDG